MRKMEAADWTSLSDQELLERRISTLGLRLEGTTLEPLIRQLYDELSAKGLAFHPPCHIGDEWFVPDRYPGHLHSVLSRARSAAGAGAHDDARSRRRNAGVVHETDAARGGARLQLRLISFSERKNGSRLLDKLHDEETPSFYRPRPFSRSYVVHLDDWYAQAHPDEDFAETFAIWLTPGLDWRTRYAGWKALQKLEYVDELMRSLAGKPPVHAPKYRVADYNCLNVKLKTYYARKRKFYEDLYPDFYDADLRQLFRRASWDQGELVSATAEAAADELGLPVDERKKISGQQISRTVDRPLRPAWVACAERRSAAEFSRHRLHHHAGDELSVHRQIQAHQITVD